MPDNGITVLLSTELEIFAKNDSKEAIGLRLKALRKFNNWKRTQIAEKLGIAPTSLKDWEIGRYKIPPARIPEILKIFKEQKIICTKEWLIYGTGNPPQWKEEKRIDEELQTFYKLNPRAIHCKIVNDESMKPYYYPGDIVAGTVLENENFKTAIGKVCIIELNEGILVVRFLSLGSELETYHLTCANIQAANPLSLFSNIRPKKIAPIKWHRKKI